MVALMMLLVAPADEPAITESSYPSLAGIPANMIVARESGPTWSTIWFRCSDSVFGHTLVIGGVPTLMQRRLQAQGDQGCRVDFWLPSGLLQHAYPFRPHRIQGWLCSNMEFSREGALLSCGLAEPVRVGRRTIPAPADGSTTVNMGPDGRTGESYWFTLDQPRYVACGQVATQGAMASLPDHVLIGGRLLEPCVAQGFPVTGFVSVYPTGGLKSASLDRDWMINGRQVARFTTIQLDQAGSVTQIGMPAGANRLPSDPS